MSSPTSHDAAHTTSAARQTITVTREWPNIATGTWTFSDVHSGQVQDWPSLVPRDEGQLGDLEEPESSYAARELGPAETTKTIYVSHTINLDFDRPKPANENEACRIKFGGILVIVLAILAL